MTLDPKLLGHRLRDLRRQRGLTQAELADRVGIRTGPMNYLENGHHLPSLPVLHRLSRELGVEVGAILHPASTLYVSEESPVYGPTRLRDESIFAANAGDFADSQAAIVRLPPQGERLDDAVVARLDAVAMSFLALEDICRVQKRAAIPLRLQLPVTERGLERLAAQVRALLGISHAVIFDYLELFENEGLRVVFLPLPDGVESLACHDVRNQNAFLFVATGYSVERQLFRLCYELGRIYLHSGGLGKRLIGCLDAHRAARRFAALFLMPEEAVAASVRQVGVGPDSWSWEMLLRLKHRFGVSAETFLYRLDELDLIAKTRKGEIERRIKVHYAETGNAEPDSTRRILTPNGRLGDLLLTARQSESYELERIEQQLTAAGVAIV